ncbi:unnamed protein product [Heligmosomoides polygyrus]|uniref:Galectin n=1 Tax=Heligmosomoides polygyrus TaxID=6339 RepID=A0A3P7YQ02_HELPZ|nr:unnamed protein product [Heligmosomoides polygyrus]
MSQQPSPSMNSFARAARSTFMARSITETISRFLLLIPEIHFDYLKTSSITPFRDFSVELLSGPHIVLHVNFRFHHEHEVVMNSASHGSWGEEVGFRRALTSLQFDHMRSLIPEVVNSFQIEVNDQLLAHYKHRFPMESVQALGLKGDFSVEKVEFHDFDIGIGQFPNSP